MDAAVVKVHKEGLMQKHVLLKRLPYYTNPHENGAFQKRYPNWRNLKTELFKNDGMMIIV